MQVPTPKVELVGRVILPSILFPAIILEAFFLGLHGQPTGFMQELGNEGGDFALVGKVFWFYPTYESVVLGIGGRCITVLDEGSFDWIAAFYCAFFVTIVKDSGWGAIEDEEVDECLLMSGVCVKRFNEGLTWLWHSLNGRPSYESSGESP